jgi:hypothetical protein
MNVGNEGNCWNAMLKYAAYFENIATKQDILLQSCN